MPVNACKEPDTPSRRDCKGMHLETFLAQKGGIVST
jgi:hypothetical protein